MRVGGAHLTYCTNIHPGESWSDVRANLESHVLAVKARVCPDEPFGVGLRLSAEAARELDAVELRRWLDAHGLYVFTINGFPYGPFHGRPVKAEVYRPDWLEDERVAYSNRLADILAVLLPDGVDGTISTVPGCLKPRTNAASDIIARITQHTSHLAAIENRTGKHIDLALEPEPCCLLETIDETVELFSAHLDSVVRRHVGVCLDTCHAAVEFEDVRGAVDKLRAAGIAIAKVQLSAGLVVDPHDRDALAPFHDDVYLHQVVARTGNTFARYVDLPDAMTSGDANEWRIHFHVPIFRAELGRFASTQPWLAELLALHRQRAVSTHLEVETYTWDVLPPEYRDEPIADAVARELRWVIERIA